MRRVTFFHAETTEDFEQLDDPNLSSLLSELRLGEGEDERIHFFYQLVS